MKPQMNTDERSNASTLQRTHAPTPRSGYDLDLCGDGIERPRVLIPEPSGIEPCPLKRGGDCPDGCDACVAFAEEMNFTLQT